MDRVDRAILYHLQEDGRLPNVELAERVRLSPSPCLRRVKALETAGVITGYHAEIAPAAVERGFQVIVHAGLSQNSRPVVEAFEAAVIELDEVVECLRMFGEPDYLIRVAVGSQDEYEGFLINKLGALPGLTRMTSQITMKTVKAGGRLLSRP